MSIGPDNAVAFLQIRLRGGWKNFATTSGVYALALVAVMVASTRIDNTPMSLVFRAWLPLLLGIQALLLFLFAGTRVTAAIRHDLNSRLIESHRLMPTTAGSAVAGYIVGAASQALVLAVVTLVIGVVVAGFAHVPMADWLLANAVLAAFCASVWGVLAYLAFAFRTPFLWVLAAPVLSMFVEGAVWVILPPLTVFWSPLIGRSMFDFGSIGGPNAPAYLTSVFVQTAVAGICFAAATRRYSRDDAIGLGPLLGLCLLGVAAAAAWIGIAWWDDFRPVWFRTGRYNRNESAQLIASLLLLMVMALIPITSAAKLRHAWRHRQTGAPARWAAPVVLVALAASAIVAAVPGAILLIPDPAGYLPQPEHRLETILTPWIATALLVLLALTTFSFVAGLAVRLRRSPAIAGVVWLALAWIGPILADAVREAAMDRPSTFDRGTVGGISLWSPAGALIASWTDASLDDMRTAIIVQAGLAVAAALAFMPMPARSPTPAMPPSIDEPRP